MKKTYKITYTETLVHTFYVDAESPEDAVETFDEDARNGEYDFSDGEVSNTKIEAEEMLEETK